jgi:hypothetical protein
MKNKILPLLLLMLAACSPLNTAQKSLLEGQANKIATCRNGPDCTAKWARAQEWIAANSVYPVKFTTDTLLETGQPPFYSPKSGFTIARQTEGYGFSMIDFASGCGMLSVLCEPDALALKASFVDYVMAGPAAAARP